MAAAKKTDGTKKPRVAKTVDQQIAAARKSVNRAATLVMKLHLAAYNVAGLQPIADAAKAMNAALIAPPAEVEA